MRKIFNQILLILFATIRDILFVLTIYFVFKVNDAERWIESVEVVPALIRDVIGATIFFGVPIIATAAFGGWSDFLPRLRITLIYLVLGILFVYGILAGFTTAQWIMIALIVIGLLATSTRIKSANLKVLNEISAGTWIGIGIIGSILSSLGYILAAIYAIIYGLYLILIGVYILTTKPPIKTRVEIEKDGA